MNVTSISFLSLMVGFLGLVSIGVIIQVVLSSQKEKLTMKSAFGGLFAIIWALPLLGVLTYFGAKVAPKLDTLTPPTVYESSVVSHESKTDAISTSPRYGESVEEWVKSDDKKTADGGDLVVVSSDANATLERNSEDNAQGARESAFEKAVEKIESYYAINNVYYGPIGITKADVEKVRKREYIEKIPQETSGFQYEMYRVHWQLELNPKLSESLVSRAKQSVSRSRIWTIGSILAACTLLLFGFSSYLRLDTQTEGRYRNRLKFAAISFMAVGCLAIAEYFPLS